jgi:hypothetical protein
MPTLFAASESSVMVDGEAVEGVSAIEYRHQQLRANVYALGSTERIGMVSGGQYVEGRLRVASTSTKLNGLTGDQVFQVIATLKHTGPDNSTKQMVVTFDECYLLDKSFSIETSGHGESVYTFSAVRVKEELSEAAAPAAP